MICWFAIIPYIVILCLRGLIVTHKRYIRDSCLVFCLHFFLNLPSIHFLVTWVGSVAVQTFNTETSKWPSGHLRCCSHSGNGMFLVHLLVSKRRSVPSLQSTFENLWCSAEIGMERASFHCCFPLCNVSSLLRPYALFSFFGAILSSGRLLHFKFDELRLRWSLCREGPCHTIRLCNSCVDSNILSFSEMSRTLCHSATAARNGTVFLQVSFCQRWRQDSRDAAA